MPQSCVTEEIKRMQIEVLGLKVTVPKMKNTLDVTAYEMWQNRILVNLKT